MLNFALPKSIVKLQFACHFPLSRIRSNACAVFCRYDYHVITENGDPHCRHFSQDQTDRTLKISAVVYYSR
jgi:hypothetical protein